MLPTLLPKKPLNPEEIRIALDDYILVTFFLGANDAVTSDSAQYVPLEEYENNMRYISQYILDVFPKAVLILVTPPKVNTLYWNTRSIDQVSTYANVVRKLGAELHQSPVVSQSLNDQGHERNDKRIRISSSSRVFVLDLWGTDNSSGSNATTSISSYSYITFAECIELTDLCDGLHMAVEGNRKILNGIQSLIRSHTPTLVPEDRPDDGTPNLSKQYPDRSELTSLLSDLDQPDYVVESERVLTA